MRANNTYNPEQIFRELHSKLHDSIPEFELRYKSQIAAEINVLKTERNAVILGHNYMEPALFHSVADIRGDSLELSRAAAHANHDVIVFCGVRFMAETAKILNPDKTVLIPSPKAGCSLADGISAEDVRRLRQQYPGVPVVSYINTHADVKAESDIICTSGNAVKVVKSLKSNTVIFLPDEFLAANVARETGRHLIVPTKEFCHRIDTDINRILFGWHSRCEVHEKFTVQDIANVRKQFPDAVVLAHPECSPDVVNASDFSGSTSAMTAFVRDTAKPRYLLLTECSMADNIAADNPRKEMLRLCSVRCPHMNEITLEQTREALLNMQYVVDVPEPIRIRAYTALNRMLDLT